MGIFEIFFQLERLLLIVLGAHTGIDMTTEDRVLLLTAAGRRIRLVLLMMHLVSMCCKKLKDERRHNKKNQEKQISFLLNTLL